MHLRLPCRAFRISYKVAETGDFTLTNEFLLRLLRLLDGLPETSMSEFFGFTTDETQFIVNLVEDRGFTQRKNGRPRINVHAMAYRAPPIVLLPMNP